MRNINTGAAIGGLLIAVSLLLSACAGRYEPAALKQRFYGKSEAELLACAGAPTSKASSGDVTVLTYSASAVSAIRQGYQSVMRTNSCRINFTLRNGVVTKVSYSAFGPLFNKTRACDRVVGGC